MIGAIPRQSFHERVPAAPLHRLQRIHVRQSLLNAVLHDKPEIGDGLEPRELDTVST